MNNLNQKLLIEFFTFILISLISSFIIFQLYASKNAQEKLSQEQIIQEAKAHFKSMQDTRLWNARFGGVYVKAKNNIQPNPYLKDNILRSDNNETLVKINPAWMTRQISELSNKQGNYHFKITSLKPLNPSNKADDFEQKALTFFEKNSNKKYFYQFNTQSENFDFMGALTVKQACMQCHKHQGYRVGDVRGGIRVTIPTQIYTQQMTLLKEKTRNSALLVIFGALMTLLIFIWLIETFFRRQYEIEHMNETLEEKISERTQKLEQLVSHEQHLKDVLTVITEVNEMLISSYSIHSILKNSTHKLSQNGAYSLVVAGLIKEDILEVVSKSLPHTSILPETIYSLKDENSHYLINAIQNAVYLKHSIVEKVALDQTHHRREEDTKLQWLIVLPLLHGNEHEVYGILGVFCSREEGFEPEEIRILDNMAHDISIALYSHKQRDAVLSMEKEKVANYEETILAFVNIIEQRDTYTAGHTIRVAEYCALIARDMGLDSQEVHHLEKAAILHDIGKVATPDAILLKPGKLTLLEYELIKQHSEVGAQMLERIEMYKGLANIIRYHHSRYDGKGYPRTSNPAEIPMLSHIMIVADAFDAMTTNRIYKPRKSVEDALAEISRQSGMQFHPEVVLSAQRVLRKINISDTTQMPSSELEQRRMAYFFQDSLTGLYNEDYLQIVLKGNDHRFRCINIINLHNFSSFNQTRGWEEGNTLLKALASLLERLYPTSTIVRYHGDDFIILNKDFMKIDVSDLTENPFFITSGIHLDVKYYEIDDSFTYESFSREEN